MAIKKFAVIKGISHERVRVGDATKTDEFSEKSLTAFDLFEKSFYFFFNFMLKKPCLKVQNLQNKFLDWKWPLPPLELFRKFIYFGSVARPLCGLVLHLQAR